MISQLTVDTTISANWVLVIVCTILAFLLVRILNRIESKLENHDVRIGDVEKDVAVIKDRDK
jgi:energy-converting hydrogenase Eha subunit H